MEPRRTNRILELDGLRAVAVIAVVISHMAIYAESLPKGPYWVEKAMESLGSSGVSVFFIISGFIITTLLVREKISLGHTSLKAFYIRRFFRIVPPFAIYLVALLIASTLNLISISYRNVLISALFLGNIGVFSGNAWFVAHTWSLSVEEQFYLLFPPLLCFILRFHARATLLALLLAYLLCIPSLKLAHDLSIKASPCWSSIAGLYNFRYIIVGVFLALYGRPILVFLANKSRLAPLLFGLSEIVLQVFQPPSIILRVLITVLEPCIVGLFVVWFMQNPSRCVFLRWPAMQWMGACSYSVYLWQQFLTGPASLYRGWGLAHSPLSTIAIVACAAISYYCVERPSIRLGQILSKRARLPISALPQVVGQSAA